MRKKYWLIILIIVLGSIFFLGLFFRFFQNHSKETEEREKNYPTIKLERPPFLEDD